MALLASTAVAGAVHNLTYRNFNHTVFFDENYRNETGWFVKFFVPWDPHCQKLEDTWEQFADKYFNLVDVGEVDCSYERELCSEYGVTTYPSLLFYPADDLHNYKRYTGDKVVESFVTFVVNNSFLK